MASDASEMTRGDRFRVVGIVGVGCRASELDLTCFGGPTGRAYSDSAQRVVDAVPYWTPTASATRLRHSLGVTAGRVARFKSQEVQYVSW